MLNPTTAVIFDPPLVNTAGFAAQLVLLWPTAFDTELAVMEQVPFAGIVRPVTAMVLAVKVAVAAQPTLPPTTAVAAGVKFRPDGRLSVNAPPVTVEAVGLTIVKVSAALLPVEMEATENVFVKTGTIGGAATVKLTLFDVAVAGTAATASALVATLLITVPAGVWAVTVAETTRLAKTSDLALKKPVFRAS